MGARYNNGTLVCIQFTSSRFSLFLLDASAKGGPGSWGVDRQIYKQRITSTTQLASPSRGQWDIGPMPKSPALGSVSACLLFLPYVGLVVEEQAEKYLGRDLLWASLPWMEDNRILVLHRSHLLWVHCLCLLVLSDPDRQSRWEAGGKITEQVTSSELSLCLPAVSDLGGSGCGGAAERYLNTDLCPACLPVVEDNGTLDLCPSHLLWVQSLLASSC